MEKAFSFVANAIGWASNRGASNTSTNYNNQFETNTNQHGNGYNNNNNTLSTSDIASERTVETSTKGKGNGAIVGTTRRSRMFTASSISCSTRNDIDMNGTPQNNQSTNTKE